MLTNRTVWENSYEAPDHATAKVQLSGPTREGFELKNPQTWAHPTTWLEHSCDVWVAKYSDGTQIRIKQLLPANPANHNHSPEQVADAARYLAHAQRALVHEIVLNTAANPDDKHWSAAYHENNFTSYMTAGDGVVNVYPTARKNPLADKAITRGAMLHETGHLWSQSKWGDDHTKGGWAHWRSAMEADKHASTSYGKSAIAEDVAETVRLYMGAKGTPQFDEYRAQVPFASTGRGSPSSASRSSHPRTDARS